MSFFARAVLWVGKPSYLVLVSGPPGRRRIDAVSEGPAFPESEPGALSAWLGPRVRRGLGVDVIYQDHLLRIDTLTGVDTGDLAGAMKIRLKKDLLMNVEGLHGLYVPLAAGDKPQCAFAAALANQHTTVAQLLESAGAVPGRVGYAGQLALRALQRRCPEGGWTVLENLAASARLVLAVGQDGQAAAAPFPPQGVDLAAAGLEIARLNLPRAKLDGPPVTLSGSMPGAPLPAPLSFTVPVLLGERKWRLPSPQDVAYPFFFAPQTWGFALIAIALAGYTAVLSSQARALRAAAPAVARLKADRARIHTEQLAVNRDLAALTQVSSHLQALGAEAFENGGWLHLVGTLRDRCAPALLFRTVTVNAATIQLDGEDDSVQPVLAFVKFLTRVVGEGSVRLGSFTRTAGGRIAFSLSFDRRSSMPPSLAEVLK